MRLIERLEVLGKLGTHLQEKDEYLEAVMQRTAYENQWFTIENQQKAIQAIATEFLDINKLQNWAAPYYIPDEPTQKVVGLVLAGNIPLVGFHDVLCVFVSGHIAQIKLSDKDPYLLPYLIKLLQQFDNRTANYFQIVEKLHDFDATIATGSNNSARYFEAYFGKVPHIIRKNRNGVAVLTGEESREALFALGEDIFQYFGLGCRNISKIYVPQGYDFQLLMEVLHEFRQVSMHGKYKNNFDYNYSLYILNKEPHLSNGAIILLENPEFQSRIATLHYEYYTDITKVEQDIQAHADEIQCVVEAAKKLKMNTLRFGQAQQPGLADYADGVDTMQFLLSLS
ncbi:MAG: acyl-CoA reductase [Saprospiraceae bacterium]